MLDWTSMSEWTHFWRILDTKLLLVEWYNAFYPHAHHQLRNGCRKNYILYVKNCWMCLVIEKLYMQLQISSVLIGMRMCTVDPEITVWVLYIMYLCRVVVCSAVTAGMDHKCSWCLLLYLPVSKFLDVWHMSFSIWSLVSALPLQVILSLVNELKNWQDFWTGLWTLTSKQSVLWWSSYCWGRDELTSRESMTQSTVGFNKMPILKSMDENLIVYNRRSKSFLSELRLGLYLTAEFQNHIANQNSTIVQLC